MLLELKQCASRASQIIIRAALAALTFGLGLGFVFLFVLAYPAYAQDGYCPDSISVTQTADKVPDGWFAGQDKSSLQLSALTFFDGPPIDEASLAYDSWTKHNGLAHGVWHFTPNTMRGTWLSCHYSGTNVVLNKKLPPSTSECTVTYDPKVTIAGNPEIKKITCH